MAAEEAQPAIKRTISSESQGDRLLSQFQLFDQNGDGTVDRKELLNVLQGLDQEKWTEARIDAVLAAADINKDGVIQYQEFLNFASKDPENQNDFLRAAEGIAPGAIERLVRTMSDASKSDGNMTIHDALEQLQGVPWEKKEPAMALLLKLLQNIVKDPTNPKFRKIKRSNKTLAEKIFSVPGCAAFLIAAGFEDSDGDELVLPEGKDVAWVVDALQSFGSQEMMEKMRAERDARIAAVKAEDAKGKELKGGNIKGGDEEERKRILAQADYDKQERAARDKLAAEGYREENQVSAEKGGKDVTRFKDIGVDVNAGG